MLDGDGMVALMCSLSANGNFQRVYHLFAGSAQAVRVARCKIIFVCSWWRNNYKYMHLYSILPFRGDNTLLKKCPFPVQLIVYISETTNRITSTFLSVFFCRKRSREVKKKKSQAKKKRFFFSFRSSCGSTLTAKIPPFRNRFFWSLQGYGTSDRARISWINSWTDSKYFMTTKKGQSFGIEYSW